MELEPVIADVEGHDELKRFLVDLGFARDEKAFTDDELAPYRAQLDEGDLLIVGWGANFDVDRQNEAFAEGAFERGLKSFLDRESVLCYHHKHDSPLGKVLHADVIPGRGVRLIARVDNQPESSPLRSVYEQVKKGTINALSCGGFFKRALTAAGRKIVDVDLTEWSITPVPVGRGTNFAVAAAKALEDFDAEPVAPDVLDLTGLSEALDRLSDAFGVKALPSGHDPQAAMWLAMTLRNVGKLREHATNVKDVVDHEKFQALADDIETQTSKWAADGHRIAAQVGPLPTLGE